LVSPR